MRLIDADALYRRIMEECNPYGKPSIGWEDGQSVMMWIACATTVGGWVSVKDRLPEGKCIAYSQISGEMLIVRVEADDKSDTGYTGESEARYLWDVTHWMPLPEPPKEEADADKG